MALNAIFGFLRGIFIIANTFIAFFIVIYAFFFLKKTRSHRERRPWDYLFFASIIYAIFTLLTMLLTIYNVEFIAEFHIVELSLLFQFIYTGLILLSFISQTDLIFKNELIIITRKLDSEQSKDIDVKILEEKRGKEEIEISEKSLTKAEADKEIAKLEEQEKELKEEKKKVRKRKKRSKSKKK